jgi:hypothetical protein
MLLIHQPLGRVRRRTAGQRRGKRSLALKSAEAGNLVNRLRIDNPNRLAPIHDENLAVGTISRRP